MFVIPALDILNGACVRLTVGDYDQKTVYDQDPVSVAKKFVDPEPRWFHVVDLDGAKAGHPVNSGLVEQIVAQTNMWIEVGGGIRTIRDVKQMLQAGVKRVVMGSRLAEDLEMAEALFHQYGEAVVAGIDTKEGMVALHGWTSTSHLRGTDLAKSLFKLGCRRVIFTDVARDGTFQGPNLDAVKEMVDATPMKVIASGGVSSLEDIAAAKAAGAEAIIVGKAFYEGRFTLHEVREAGF